MTTDHHRQLPWRTSSYSGSNGGQCVEVAPGPGEVLIRHSKRHADGVIAFPVAAWHVFVREVLTGEPSANGVVTVVADGTDTVVADIVSGVQLRFDEGEWAAFVKGAAAQEFSFGLAA